MCPLSVSLMICWYHMYIYLLINWLICQVLWFFACYEHKVSTFITFVGFIYNDLATVHPAKLLWNIVILNSFASDFMILLCINYMHLLLHFQKVPFWIKKVYSIGMSICYSYLCSKRRICEQQCMWFVSSRFINIRMLIKNRLNNLNNALVAG